MSFKVGDKVAITDPDGFIWSQNMDLSTITGEVVVSFGDPVIVGVQLYKDGNPFDPLQNGKSIWHFTASALTLK